MKNRPKILVTNDDGIYSPGIYALWESLSEIGDVTIVAPRDERSAASHSITINNLLRVEHINRDQLFNGYSVNGTPADCTKIAIKQILKDIPDLVVSGINKGSNLGNNIMYSGTIAAAAEGSILNVPSIAISLDSHNAKDWRGAKVIAKDISKYVLKNGLPKGIILNVNIPYCEPDEIKGIKITRQGNQYFEDQFEKRLDTSGREYFWIKGKIIDLDRSIKYDGKAIEMNYVSVTPIRFDFTDNLFMNELKINLGK